MRGKLLPPALQPGQTISIVSPSWFGGDAYLPRAERGIAYLQSLGFSVRVAPHAFHNQGWVSDTAAHRAADLHAMFADPEVRAIVATIGGDHSCHLLPLLDWELIRGNPKIFMGFSDITVLNVAISTMTGLVTFNGPSLLTDWSEYPEMPIYSRDHALRAIMRPEPLGELRPAVGWTDEFLDWTTGEDLTRPRHMRSSAGWRWLHPGSGQGPLIGGCLESLQHLRGTPYWPDLHGAVLFLETSEEKPTPDTVDAVLMDYENMGVLAEISGLVLGRPYGYTDDEKNQFHEVVAERMARFGVPVLAGVDFGHTSPMLTLPIGCEAILDATQNRFAIVEPAVL